MQAGILTYMRGARHKQGAAMSLKAQCALQLLNGDRSVARALQWRRGTSVHTRTSTVEPPKRTAMRSCLRKLKKNKWWNQCGRQFPTTGLIKHSHEVEQKLRDSTKPWRDGRCACRHFDARRERACALLAMHPSM